MNVCIYIYIYQCIYVYIYIYMYNYSTHKREYARIMLPLMFVQQLLSFCTGVNYHFNNLRVKNKHRQTTSYRVLEACSSCLFASSIIIITIIIISSSSSSSIIIIVIISIISISISISIISISIIC